MKWIIYLIFLDAGMGMYIPFNNIYGNFSIIDIIVLIGIFLNLILFKKKISLNKYSLSLAAIYFGFAFFQLTSILISNNSTIEALGPVIRNLFYLLLIISLISEINSTKVFNKAIIFFLVGIFFNNISVLYFWSLDERYINGIIYLNNEIINRNVVYYYAVFSIPLLFYILQIMKRKILKFSIVLMILLNSIICMLTFSKGAWVILIMIILISLMNITKRKSLIKKSTVLLAVVVLLFYANSYGLFNTFTESKIENYNVENDARTDYKLFALQTGFLNPWGLGTKSYKEYTEKYAPHPSTTDPHDAALMMFVEAGFLAFVLYWYLQYLYIRLIYINKKKICHNIKEREYIINLLFNMYLVFFILSLFTGMVFTSKLSMVIAFLIVSSTMINIKK